MIHYIIMNVNLAKATALKYRTNDWIEPLTAWHSAHIS